MRCRIRRRIGSIEMVGDVSLDFPSLMDVNMRSVLICGDSRANGSSTDIGYRVGFLAFVQEREDTGYGQYDEWAILLHLSVVFIRIVCDS